jgi:hypothetical protein
MNAKEKSRAYFNAHLIQEAGFERWYYRKISPFSFLCTARKV